MLNASRRLASLPKSFHGPLIDQREDTQLGATLQINGAPATGKSTMARLYAEHYPLTLALDLDLLRSMLGGWFDQPQQAD